MNPHSWLIASLVAFSSVSVVAGPPQFNRPNRPTVSPYINLLSPEGQANPAIVYYGQIRPQQEFRAANSASAAAIRGLDKRLTTTEKEMPSGKLSASGHATSFLNTRGYFGGRR
ncbi:MAG TPA: hypothetical protein VL132_20735 [Planctomycetaceae bacterium]|jgi:hypothetical protein|nr:hypothetical protein [Planctomycetaceae bacterium]